MSARIDHFVMYVGDAAVIHRDGDCLQIPALAAMGAAMTERDAYASTLPMCGACARRASMARHPAGRAMA